MSLRFYPLWVIHLSQSVLVLCVSSQTVCLAPHSPSLTTADCVLAKLRSTAIWRMHDVQITVGLSRGGVSNWKTWNLSYPRSMWHKVGQSWTSCQCWSNAQTEAIKRLEWLCYSLWFRIVFFLMCERGGLSVLQKSEWKHQICYMLDLEYATQASYFQCRIRAPNMKMSAAVW